MDKSRLFRDYWSQFLTGASTLGIAIGSLGFTLREKPLPLLHERWEVWVFWVSIIGAIVSIIATAKNSESLTRLRIERDFFRSRAEKLQHLEEDVQQKYSDLCSLHLAGLIRRMGLGENDRISIYKHNGTGFWRIARHSSHPDYARPGRSIYPDDQGCMGEAFREGYAFEESLPAKWSAYNTKLSNRWNMGNDVIDQLTMRSRSIAAFALHRPIGGRRFAIIVFESMSAGSIDGVTCTLNSPRRSYNI